MTVERTREVMTHYLDSGHEDLSMMAEDVVFTNMATGEEHRGVEGVRRMLDYVYHDGLRRDRREPEPRSIPRIRPSSRPISSAPTSGDLRGHPGDSAQGSRSALRGVRSGEWKDLARARVLQMPVLLRQLAPSTSSTSSPSTPPAALRARSIAARCRAHRAPSGYSSAVPRRDLHSVADHHPEDRRESGRRRRRRAEAADGRDPEDGRWHQPERERRPASIAGTSARSTRFSGNDRRPPRYTFFDQPSTRCGRLRYIRVSISRSAKAKWIRRPARWNACASARSSATSSRTTACGADRLVALARHQDELAVRDYVALPPGAVHPRRVIAQGQQQPDLRHDQPLPERLATLPGRDGHQIGPLRLERADRSRQQLGLVPGVGVGEEEECRRAPRDSPGGTPRASRTIRPARALRGPAGAEGPPREPLDDARRCRPCCGRPPPGAPAGA